MGHPRFFAVYRHYLCKSQKQDFQYCQVSQLKAHAQSSVQVQDQAHVALFQVLVFQFLVFLVQVVVGPGAGLVRAV